MGKPEKAKKTDLPAATQALLEREQPFSFSVQLPKDRPVEKVIILLHGMFHNANAMLKGAREEIRAHEPGAGLYALNAPFPADPQQHLPAQKPRGGKGFRVWYELPKGRLYPRREIVAPMEVSVLHVQKMISYVKRKHGLREDQIHLLAFSQGCAPALQAAVERERKGRPLASVALLCGNAWDPDIFPSTKKIDDTEAPPPPSDIPNEAKAKQRWFDNIVKWVLRKRDATITPPAAPAEKAELDDDDIEPIGLPEAKGRTPIFYAYIEQDDTVPIGLSWYTATFMRAHHMAVDLHISPSYVAKVPIKNARFVRHIQTERPTYLRFRSKLILPGINLPGATALLDETSAKLPPGHELIYRPTSIIHLSKADDGFGNQVAKVHDIRMKMVIDSHWVNPSIQQALTFWHVHGLRDPISGVAPLYKTKLPKLTQEQVEYGWAINKTELNVDKPAPLPQWLRPTTAFNSLRAELRHLFWTAAAHIALAASRPIHHWFLHEPDPNERTFQSQKLDGKNFKTKHLTPAQEERIKAARKHFDHLESEHPPQKPDRKSVQHPENT